jgi:hypothetical protein
MSELKVRLPKGRSTNFRRVVLIPLLEAQDAADYAGDALPVF